MNRRRTTFLSVLATGLLASSLGVVTPATAAPAPTSAKAAARTGSDIALKAFGYGTSIEGGQVPVGSGMTAFTAIGCDVRGNITRNNAVANADLAGNGAVSGVKTEIWTKKVGSALHSYTRSTTAAVVLADTPLGSLSIRGVTTLSHAWHDDKGFHAEAESSIGKIVATLPTGGTQTLPIPTPNRPLTIPGLGTITLGHAVHRANDTGSVASAYALQINLTATGTKITVARSSAKAMSGVKNGVFGGYSAGTEVKALDGLITSGRNPLTLMPCMGTDGKRTGKQDAHVDLGGQLVVDGVSSSQNAKRYASKSVMWERGAVAGVNLGNGQLVVDAIVGKAAVTRLKSGKVITSTAGTTVGKITVAGQEQELPIDQPIEIPGLAKIESKVVTKFSGGVKVVALRITLLGGTGAVIDLGVARARISRS